MKRITIFGILLMACFLGLNACYYDNEATLYPESINCNVDSVTYSLTIKPLVDANCATAGCHVPGTGRVDLTTYQGTKAIADNGEFRQYVLVAKTMPETGPLSVCDMARVDAWLKAGAPNN